MDECKYKCLYVDMYMNLYLKTLISFVSHQVSIKSKDIVAMTKEKTALVIPNAIEIRTEGEKHFFTSFASRDKTYLMLFRIWQNALMDQVGILLHTTFFYVCVCRYVCVHVYFDSLHVIFALTQIHYLMAGGSTRDTRP